nr:hypothetical protein [Acidobacteriota bacterium]
MLRRVLLVTVVLASGFIAGLVLTGRMQSAGESSAAQGPSVPEEQARPTVAVPQGLPDLTGIAERAVNAVTSISS